MKSFNALCFWPWCVKIFVHHALFSVAEYLPGIRSAMQSALLVGTHMIDLKNILMNLDFH